MLQNSTSRKYSKRTGQFDFKKTEFEIVYLGTGISRQALVHRIDVVCDGEEAFHESVATEPPDAIELGPSLTCPFSRFFEFGLSGTKPLFHVAQSCTCLQVGCLEPWQFVGQFLNVRLHFFWPWACINTNEWRLSLTGNTNIRRKFSELQKNDQNWKLKVGGFYPTIVIWINLWRKTSRNMTNVCTTLELVS